MGLYWTWCGVFAVVALIFGAIGEHERQTPLGEEVTHDESRIEAPPYA